MLILDNVSVAYTQRSGGLLSRKNEFVAVDRVSFSVETGRSIGIVGESGSGKSSLVRALIGLHAFSGGTVTIDGEEIDYRRNLWQLRKRMQMVFQDPSTSINPRRSVGSQLDEPLKNYTELLKNARNEKMIQCLESVGLGESALSRMPHEFSGGQKQRIGLARALLIEPDWLIADEPVSALDVSVQAQILNLINDHRKKRNLGLIMVGHDLSVMRYSCEHLVVMHRGRIVESAPADQLFAQPQHPYTRSLIAAMPTSNWQKRDEQRSRRKQAAQDFEQHHDQHYDDMNRPFDLQPFQNQHLVSRREALQ